MNYIQLSFTKGFAFYAAGCMSICLMLLLSFCLLLPPILTGYQVIWIMWVVLPILSISMLFTPHDDGIMLLMPGKYKKKEKSMIAVLNRI